MKGFLKQLYNICLSYKPCNTNSNALSNCHDHHQVMTHKVYELYDGLLFVYEFESELQFKRSMSPTLNVILYLGK